MYRILSLQTSCETSKNYVHGVSVYLAGYRFLVPACYIGMGTWTWASGFFWYSVRYELQNKILSVHSFISVILSI